MVVSKIVSLIATVKMLSIITVANAALNTRIATIKYFIFYPDVFHSHHLVKYTSVFPSVPERIFIPEI